MRILLTFILLYTSSAYAKECRIESFDRIFHINDNNGHEPKLIKYSNCPGEIDNTFLKFVHESKGKFNQETFNRINRNYLDGYKVYLVPSQIRSLSLSDYLKSKFKLKEKWLLTNLKFLNKRKAIGLDNGQSINANCQNCIFTGNKNIKVQIYNPIKNNSLISWLTADLAIMTEVLVLKRTISVAEKSLSPNDFRLKAKAVTKPDLYFSNAEKLVFYKLNKPLQEDAALKFSDLTPINLVTRGVPTKVILKNKSISLRGTGTPIENGKHGETIKLRNNRTKKLIVGKVIDFNKVMVEL